MLERLGRYAIESEIGKGGMGTVYRALDERLGKTVAIKVLSDTAHQSPESRTRLRREARAAAILNHPAIVGVYDYDEQDGVPFIVYEYIEGKTLDQVISGSPLRVEQMLEIASQLAGALSYAHERGILHRDIKPQNIMVTADGQVKILDFGLAKKADLALLQPDGKYVDTTTIATAAGMIVGTVQYMSPEQIGGETLDGRSDVFSLGVVLYEMASGKNPFHGQSFASTVGKIMSPEVPSFNERECSVPPGVSGIIARALQKKRADRYPSARMLQNDVDQLRVAMVAGRPAPAPWLPSETRGSVIPRRVARRSLVLLQVLYLGIYAVSLYYHEDVYRAFARGFAGMAPALFWRVLGIPWHGVLVCGTALLVSACVGIAIRLYLIASVAFDDPDTGSQFRKLFPHLAILDYIWAIAPFLVNRWPAGVALACMAILSYLPISHLNLVRSAYPANPASR